MIVLKKGEIQRPYIFLCYKEGKHISLIQTVNISSKINICAFFIVAVLLYSLFNNNNNSLIMSQTKTFV